MNERQFRLLQKLLLHTDELFQTRVLATSLDCSEKTVRNDLDKIEAFLEKYDEASLLRRPGAGVQITVTDQEKKSIFQHLFQKGTNSNNERLIDIAFRLLIESRPVTMQGLSREFYTTSEAIKNDISTISEWLKTYEIQVRSKRRLGVKVEGEELQKRNALAHLPELVSEEVSADDITRLFPGYEVNQVRHSLIRILQENGYEVSVDKMESLVIHALVMLKRARQSSTIVIKNEEVSEVSETEAYGMSEAFATRIRDDLKVSLPLEEKLYFALHLMSGTSSSMEQEDQGTTTLIIDQLMSQLQIMTMTNFTTDSILREGLEVHLPSTVHRVKYGLVVRNPMLGEIRKMYPYMFSMVLMALEEVKDNYSIDIPEDEAAYLVLHFQASVERLQKRRDVRKKVLIVCEHGVGMSHLLEAKLEQSYKGLDIVGCVGVHEMEEKLEDTTIDFILATRELNERSVPVVVISPLMQAEDRRKLNQFLQREEQQSITDGKMKDLLTDGAHIFQAETTHRYKLVEKISGLLLENRMVTGMFPVRAVARECTSPTAIGGGVAIPHAPSEEVIRSSVSLVTLKEPLEWGKEKVSLVFLLAISKEDQSYMRSIMHSISRISDNAEMIQLLKNTETIEEAMEVLE